MTGSATCRDWLSGLWFLLLDLCRFGLLLFLLFFVYTTTDDLSTRLTLAFLLLPFFLLGVGGQPICERYGILSEVLIFLTCAFGVFPYLPESCV
jgi:hypothetical protein